jgi:hypothetical protein
VAINNEEFFKLIKGLPEDAKKSAYDYLRYLFYTHSRPDWHEIREMEPENIPLSEEEERRLKNNSELVSWEDVKRELNLQKKSARHQPISSSSFGIYFLIHSELFPFISKINKTKKVLCTTQKKWTVPDTFYFSLNELFRLEHIIFLFMCFLTVKLFYPAVNLPLI